MANALYGSPLLVGLATAFSVPVGLLAAIYLSEYRSDRLGPAARFVGELLGGVPSIVIGIFAYAVVVKPLGHFSGWAGGFPLGVMMVPIVMRAAEEALKLVPRALREASHALGARQWQTVLRVSVPAALPATITAIFLGIARVAGETAPLLLTRSASARMASISSAVIVGLATRCAQASTTLWELRGFPALLEAHGRTAANTTITAISSARVGTSIATAAAMSG
jgi:phosphate transport system permease protein